MKRNVRAHATKSIRSARDRGSALLVTLMVMAGLSLLGLAFVAISETESTISVNERNYAQTHAVAEAGAKVVLEWFQDPVWALAQGVMPGNTNSIKTLRRVIWSGSYAEDHYKEAGGLLCDKPFKGARENRFFGDEAHADVIITTASTTTPANFLTLFNNALFNDQTAGRVTEIRIYAPPMVDATLNANGFYEGGTRYGVATIKVTASRFDNNGNAIATRWVKLVVSEWPFPGPQGPVQSNANISTAGNFGVHWGRMMSDGEMTIKKPLVGRPWYDAWDMLHFEDGYYGDATKDSLNRVIPGATFEDQWPWMYKIYGQDLQDPWYEARAKGQITNATDAGLTAPQPYKFNGRDQNITNEPDVGYSNWFQFQDHDEGPPGDYKNVVFPRIDYDFWKNISQAASTTNSTVYYLRWVSGEDYTNGIETKNFAQWVNTARATDPAKPGFYFFDTRNGLNPQGVGAPGVLAPDITLNSADDGSVFEMKGFIYLNVSSFGTTGIRGPGGWFNFPGEPYRDIGYLKFDTATSTFSAGPIGGGNGKWDCQSDLNDNGGTPRCDIFVAPYNVEWPPGSGTMHSYYLPVPYFVGCHPGMNGTSFGGSPADCSEPHEPFLNLIYPDAACCAGGGAPNAVRVGWEDPASFTQRPLKTDANGAPVPCDVSASPPDDNCTHNGRNEAGSLVENFGSAPNTKPILDGILYNEGDFDTQGNAAYFGSVLIQGNINGTGTPEVWFDECLLRGCWQDKFKELPRVYVTAEETDQ